MNRGQSVALGTVLLALTLGGCGAPSQTVAPPAASSTPSAPALPPRPVTLPLAGINPCDLLTDAQVHQLGTNAGMWGPDSGSGSPTDGDACLWTNFPDSPDNQWGASTVLRVGAEYALGKEPLRSVGGFAATTAGTAGTDQSHFCAMLIDVAPHQALLVTYDNGSKSIVGMTHPQACDKAQRAAEMMIPNLRAIRHQ